MLHRRPPPVVERLCKIARGADYTTASPAVSRKIFSFAQINGLSSLLLVFLRFWRICENFSWQSRPRPPRESSFAFLTKEKIILDFYLRLADNTLIVWKGKKMTDKQFELFLMHGGMMSEGLKSEEALAFLIRMGTDAGDITWLVEKLAIASAAGKVATDQTQ